MRASLVVLPAVALRFSRQPRGSNLPFRCRQRPIGLVHRCAALSSPIALVALIEDLSRSITPPAAPP